MRSMVTKSGNDRIYTPRYLAKEIIEHFKPTGVILEPCCGDGSFLEFIPAALWCEIDKGSNLFEWNKRVDWIITNPPYSQYRKFLEHSFDIADNVVFLQFVNAFFMRRRVEIMKEKRFEIKEIYYIPTPPKPWPQTGFQIGCIYFKKS